MMAALIIRSQAKSLPRDGEGTMFVHSPEALRTWWLERHFVGTFGLSQLGKSYNMPAKMILSGQLSGSRPISNTNTLIFCNVGTEVSQRNTGPTMPKD